MGNILNFFKFKLKDLLVRNFRDFFGNELIKIILIMKIVI